MVYNKYIGIIGGTGTIGSIIVIFITTTNSLPCFNWW